MTQQQSRLRRWLWPALRAVIGLTLAFVLVRYTLASTGTDLRAVLRGASVPLLAVAAAIPGVTIGVGVVRWSLLLRVQGIRLRYRELGRLTMIGVFFAMAPWGVAGGDVVKMVYIARRVPGKTPEAVLAAVLDRFLGVFGLFVVASIAVLLSLDFLLGLDPAYRPLQAAAFTVGLGSVAGVVGLVALAFHDVLLRHAAIRWLLGRASHAVPARAIALAGRLSDALRLYRRDRCAVAAAIGLSLLVHSLVAIGLLCLVRAVGDEQLCLRDCFLATQVSNAVSAVPLTPAGVGTRDIVMKTFFEAMGASGATAGGAPVVLSAILVFWGLIAGVVFVVSRGLPSGGTVSCRGSPEAGTGNGASP